MIHIQKINEGIEILKKDVVSVNISSNIHFNGKRTKQYINRVYLKIKVSDNAMSEGEGITKEDCMYRLEELRDIESITIDEITYRVPWKESKKEYGVNVLENTKRDGDIVEITIFKPKEENRK